MSKRNTEKNDRVEIGTYVCSSCNGHGAMKFKGECFRCFTLRTNPIAREARASVSLDGDTRCCMACVQKVEHVCGKRVMTVAERELVDSVMAYDETWQNYEAVKQACRALRAERKEAAK